MRSKISVLVLVLALCLGVAVVTLANSVERPRWVLSGGASDSADQGDVGLRATLGQPVVGVVSSGDITLGQGFWGGVAPTYNTYLPLVIRG